MRRLIIILCLLLLHSLVFAQHETQKDDTFRKYEYQKIDYYAVVEGEGYKERILNLKEEVKWTDDSIIYDRHTLLDSFCNIDFYEFHTSASHFFFHIAMIDNERNTIAFLDTLLLPQTLDSITNVLKRCDEPASPKKLFNFFDRIKGIYKFNKSVGINYLGSYSSPSQAVVNLLSAEYSLNFDKAKRFIDFERIYKSEEEWKDRVRANPPSLDFFNYWFTVEEYRRSATVTTRYNNKVTKYSLRRYWGKWRVVGIEWEEE